MKSQYFHRAWKRNMSEIPRLWLRLLATFPLELMRKADRSLFTLPSDKVTHSTLRLWCYQTEGMPLPFWPPRNITRDVEGNGFFGAASNRVNMWLHRYETYPERRLVYFLCKRSKPPKTRKPISSPLSYHHKIQHPRSRHQSHFSPQPKRRYLTALELQFLLQ